MIIPTVGRIVHYHMDAVDIGEGLRTSVAQAGVVPAMIVNVWSDSCVNIVGWDADGIQFTRTSVYLDQAETPDPSGYSRWCSWPTRS